MSHLSILPTVLRDADCLAASLVSMGHHPVRGGCLRGFAAEAEPVELQVEVEPGLSLGWARQRDGSLSLVGDLQRISRSRSLQTLLSDLTRRYASRLALQQAETGFQGASITVLS
ncbi:MAG: DUF1257 domain-containing protein [Synechococcus sp.]|nr:DUF1257 domain-containing protein [Synechococcus sp.]